MTVGTLRPRRLLKEIYGTEPFAAYCESRGIQFRQVVGFLMTELDYDRWQGALRGLPAERQTQVELELTQVQAMAATAAISLLIDGVSDKEPLPADIPGDAARAMWFLIHHPTVFRNVALQREIADVHLWRIAQAPPAIVIGHAKRRCQVLAENLKDFFRSREGQGHYCTVESHKLGDACCFTAHLSDRLQVLEHFAHDGTLARHPSRPAFSVVFVYYPGDGRILLKTRLRAPGKILDLFRHFGRTVLSVELDTSALAPAFRLGRFKQRFEPLPDASDMESIRVKAILLTYPERLGRRRMKLETLPGDDQFAILDLLRVHGGGEEVLEHLEVVHVELEIRLRAEGRSRVCLVRLWPYHSNLNETPLGQRLRTCLARWGVTHAA